MDKRRIYQGDNPTPVSGLLKGVSGEIKEYVYVFQCQFCGRIFKHYSELLPHQRGEIEKWKSMKLSKRLNR